MPLGEGVWHDQWLILYISRFFSLSSLAVASFEQDASGISVDFVGDDTDVMRKHVTTKKW